MHINLRFFTSLLYHQLIFYCLQEPAEGCGGLTPVCDSEEFMGKLDPRIIDKLEEKQVRYIHRQPDKSTSTYGSWQQMFKTEDIEVCRERKRQEIVSIYQGQYMADIHHFYLMLYN